MRIVIVGRERSDYGRELIDYRRDFNHITGGQIELLDPDSFEGEAFCRAYGITNYPSVIAVANDGRMQQLWSGKPLPTINELSYYN